MRVVAALCIAAADLPVQTFLRRLARVTRVPIGAPRDCCELAASLFRLSRWAESAGGRRLLVPGLPRGRRMARFGIGGDGDSDRSAQGAADDGAVAAADFVADGGAGCSANAPTNGRLERCIAGVRRGGKRGCAQQRIANSSNQRLFLAKIDRWTDYRSAARTGLVTVLTLQ